jgi:aspartate kinase
LKDFHIEISKSLNLFDEVLRLGIEGELNRIRKLSIDSPYERLYDSIVSAGEILSSIILHAAIQTKFPNASWLDSRMVIKTNSSHKRAEINLEYTERSIHDKLINQQGVWISQGFIGASEQTKETTTLGREGSDYSAAIFAYSLKAKELTIWKDVPGLMSGDPKFFRNVQLLHEVPYDEAMEMAFFGASVIHPKTIQPLKSRNIVLHVRSFFDNQSRATQISNFNFLKPKIPCFLRKSNQTMIEVKSKDLSFVSDGQLSDIYNIFSNIGLTVNLAQHSATKGTFCISSEPRLIAIAVSKLNSYDVFLENDLVLYTIRNPNEESKNWLTRKGQPKMEQSSATMDQALLLE